MIFCGFFGMLLSMTVILGGLIYRAQSHAELLAENEFYGHVDDIVTVLDVEVANLQKLATQIARHPDLPRMLDFGDPLELQDWTLHTREMIPNVVGLAVFDQLGDLYGNSGSQHVGPLCQADIRKLVNDGSAPRYPFHGVNENFRHFDIVVPIDGKGARGHHLLISFQVALLEDRMRQMMGSDTHYRLSDSNGGKLVDLGSTDSEDIVRYQRSIPGTGWVLDASSNLKNSAEFGRQSWGIFTMVSIGAFVLALVVVQLLRRRLEEDMHILKKQMAMIHESKFEDTTTVGTPYFLETGELNRFINEQSHNIQLLTRELEKEARHDSLTGLLNRRALDESDSRLISLARRGYTISVLLIDLDGFKEVNDRLGHESGDSVLTEFAESLRAISRLSDECFRLGGDEFIVAQFDMTPEALQQWFDKLHAAVTVIAGKLIPAENADLNLGISAGCAWIRAEDESLRSVIQRADVALYQAKRGGRGRLEFEPETGRAGIRRVESR